MADGVRRAKVYKMKEDDYLNKVSGKSAYQQYKDLYAPYKKMKDYLKETKAAPANKEEAAILANWKKDVRDKTGMTPTWNATNTKLAEMRKSDDFSLTYPRPNPFSPTEGLHFLYESATQMKLPPAEKIEWMKRLNYYMQYAYMSPFWVRKMITRMMSMAIPRSDYLPLPLRTDSYWLRNLAGGIINHYLAPDPGDYGKWEAEGEKEWKKIQEAEGFTNSTV